MWTRLLVFCIDLQGSVKNEVKLKCDSRSAASKKNHRAHLHFHEAEQVIDGERLNGLQSQTLRDLTGEQRMNQAHWLMLQRKTTTSEARS